MANMFRADTDTDTAHICRDEGYSPYVRKCFGCISQMSKNGRELSDRKSAPKRRLKAAA